MIERICIGLTFIFIGWIYLIIEKRHLEIEESKVEKFKIVTDNVWFVISIIIGFVLILKEIF